MVPAESYFHAMFVQHFSSPTPRSNIRYWTADRSGPPCLPRPLYDPWFSCVQSVQVNSHFNSPKTPTPTAVLTHFSLSGVASRCRTRSRIPCPTRPDFLQTVHTRKLDENVDDDGYESPSLPRFEYKVMIQAEFLH